MRTMASAAPSAAAVPRGVGRGTSRHMVFAGSWVLRVSNPARHGDGSSSNGPVVPR